MSKKVPFVEMASQRHDYLFAIYNDLITLNRPLYEFEHYNNLTI